MIKKHTISLLVALIALQSTLVFAQGYETEADTAVPDSGYTAPPQVYSVSDATPETLSSCCPKGPIGLVIDKDYSPEMGGSGLISIWRSYMALDDYLWPSTQGDTSAYMMLARLGKLGLENVVLSTGMITQHEVFGHGWRAREFNLPIYRYGIRPYSGYTVFSLTKYLQLSPSERIAFVTGGMEADGLLAKQLRDRWLETKFIDEREGQFYLVTALDQTLYVLNNRKEKTFNDGGNDVQAYLREINNWYGHTVLTDKQLRRKEMIDFLDPYMWYSLYSMGHYVIDGTPCFDYPMIPIGSVQYLPGFRIALAPYGPEYQFINYIRALDYTLQATLRYGNTGGKNSEGLTIEMTKLWADNCLSIDGRADVWSQPQMFISTSHLAPRKSGAALSLIGRFRIINNFELMGQLGYKTTGYMPGEALKRGPILRAGFFVHL